MKIWICALALLLSSVSFAASTKEIFCARQAEGSFMDAAIVLLDGNYHLGGAGDLGMMYITTEMKMREAKAAACADDQIASSAEEVAQLTKVACLNTCGGFKTTYFSSVSKKDKKTCARACSNSYIVESAFISGMNVVK